MSHRHRWLAGTCVGTITAGLLFANPTITRDTSREAPDGRDTDSAPAPAGPTSMTGATAAGAFLGSGPDGTRRIAKLENWLGGIRLRAGHTYLPGDRWSNIEGRPSFLRPWASWRRADDDRLFVLNVPMLERNEENVPDAEVRRLLRSGARGRYDHHFRTLAERLVRLSVPDTVIVLGWEMNGTTYTHRCAPHPRAWKAYWKRIVTTMRRVPGQKFRFDFTPNRGTDAIAWTKCYPGDELVDIIGMDSYDQPPGKTFDSQVNQPFGLQHHVDFAAERGKPISYPEWGLFRNGDNAEYMRRMLEWMDRHKPLYQTVTDYCPHGVWRCRGNPRSTAVYRATVSPRGDSVPQPALEPSTAASRLPGPALRSRCTPMGLGEWIERWLDGRRVCVRHDRFDGGGRS
jgi:Glycosyl hydrolase family 26